MIKKTIKKEMLSSTLKLKEISSGNKLEISLKKLVGHLYHLYQSTYKVLFSWSSILSFVYLGFNLYVFVSLSFSKYSQPFLYRRIALRIPA
jgi:hypothetical protein